MLLSLIISHAQAAEPLPSDLQDAMTSLTLRKVQKAKEIFVEIVGDLVGDCGKV